MALALGSTTLRLHMRVCCNGLNRSKMIEKMCPKQCASSSGERRLESTAAAHVDCDPQQQVDLPPRPAPVPLAGKFKVPTFAHRELNLHRVRCGSDWLTDWDYRGWAGSTGCLALEHHTVNGPCTRAAGGGGHGWEGQPQGAREDRRAACSCHRRDCTLERASC